MCVTRNSEPQGRRRPLPAKVPLSQAVALCVTPFPSSQAHAAVAQAPHQSPLEPSGLWPPPIAACDQHAQTDLDTESGQQGSTGCWQPKARQRGQHSELATLGVEERRRRKKPLQCWSLGDAVTDAIDFTDDGVLVRRSVCPWSPRWLVAFGCLWPAPVVFTGADQRGRVRARWRV
jgi:hypothetical protein